MNTNQTDTNQMQEQEIDLVELFYKLIWRTGGGFCWLLW